MQEAARRYVEANPDTVGLLRRCWRAEDERNHETISDEDRQALADWVADRVLHSPLPVPWGDWPMRFTHRSPHHDLSEFFPV